MPGKAKDQEARNARVRAVQQAAPGLLRRGEVWATQTRRGPVRIAAVEVTGEPGRECVEVHLAGAVEGGDPHFRIFNPPTLVPDPEGPVEVHGQRYREDPMQALAEVVAQHGGAEDMRKARGRRGSR